MSAILVSGGSGQLATCLKSEWKTDDFYALHFATSSEINFYDYQTVRNYLREHEVDYLIHTSAYTAVDQAEDEPEKAHKVNVEQTEAVAKACKDEGVFLVHISTDFVYGGAGESPKKIEDAEPKSVYGKTKLESEEKVRESGVDYLIIRTSWLYSREGKNFYNTMNKLLGEGKALNVVDDQHGTPTSAYSLSRFIRDFVKSENHFGIKPKTIMNFSNEGSTTWYGFASKIAEINELSGSVSPCTSEEYPQKAKRPSYSVMDLSTLRSTGWENERWEEALREVAGM
ncbi:MAG: dTDP-4-dehydrorhamnose reductase [Oceanospirillaceae bacterium]|nr:dTDP-4-dehydrorhamnose reductase [Oceanospirillaceae bacterium]